MTAAMGQAALPCVGNAALYDIVLFGEAASNAERVQAVHRAAALCGSCPARCDQMVTVDSGPTELVLLEPGWMPPVREGRPEPRMPVGGKRDAHPDIQVGVDYVQPDKRVAVWAAMAAERAAAGHSFGAIATDLCVPVDAVARLVEMGQQGRAA